MSTPELETTYAQEIDLVEQWRQQELERAGYDSKSAFVLAVSLEIDLHSAVDLLKNGCSAELALEILL
ncbi:MAG TPA: hypothetical protein VHI12_02255 [Gaiellaceae bacterium]|jgi:hypothetical protein|nr:hypothetical protein [Gaiellaceae bacterium]